MSLPDDIDFEGSNYNVTQRVSERIDLIYKTENIISPYYSKEGKD